MKQIGYTDGATKDHVWHLTDDGMISPHVLSVSDLARHDEFYIERDYLNIGWIFPADAANNGGKIYPDKQGSNSVAAYVKRKTEPQPEQFATRGEIDEIREVIAGLNGRIDTLEKQWNMNREELTSHEMIGMPRHSAPMTFYDYALIAGFLAVNINVEASDAEITKAAHKIAALITAARHPA